MRGQIHSDLQRLQAGEAAESSVRDKAHAVVSNVELVQQAEAHEAGLLESGQVVGGEVAVRRERDGVRSRNHVESSNIIPALHFFNKDDFICHCPLANYVNFQLHYY